MHAPDAADELRDPAEPAGLGRDEVAPTVLPLARRTEDSQALVAAAYTAHQREIYSFALHATRSPEAAEDIAQEAFLRLLHEVGDGRTPDNIRAWLYRVASNLVISRGRRQTVAGRWLSALGRQEVTHESPERITIGRESNEGLQAALASLPRDTRVALLMAAQGFSGQEIAGAIRRSEAATRTMLCRARLQLRERLDPPDGGR
jgi:RNA polymerase sigma-70 factor (ECF subfamily)